MPLNFHGSFQPRKELSETKLISFVLFSPAFIRVVICHDINAFEMSFLLMYKLRSRFLLLLFLFLGISNILIIINYQYATKSSKYFVASKDQNQELLLVNWKGLQIEIDTTFQKFKEIREREGKAYKQAALYGNKLTPKVNISDEHGQVNSTSSSPDCNPAPFLLIQIHSSPANVMERQAIRISWGRPENRINKANGWKQVGMSG